MHYFLDPDFRPEPGLLNAEESRHATKSLRLTTGHELVVGDGRGKRFHCRIAEQGKQGLKLEVLGVEEFSLPEKKLCLGLSPTKNTSRFEWWLEKSTELGVHQLMPLLSARTEHPRVNAGRMERITLAASKQSQRSHLPQLDGLTPFAEALQHPAALRIIAHCISGRKRKPLRQILQDSTASGVIILVGPEGDFSEEEVQQAAAAGFAEASLGSQRLRTETAGVYCASLWAAINDNDAK